MRILAVENQPEHVSFRYRIDAFRPFMEANGHDLIYERWPVWWKPLTGFWHAIRDADLVITQRRLLPASRLDRLRRTARQLVFDFDDAVFLRDSFDRRGQDCDQRKHNFAAMVRAADAVVAGNAFLRDEACFWTRPDKVHLVPTCVEVERYPQAEHLPSAGGARLAWIGSGSTLRGLERIRGLLEELGKTNPGLNLNVICDRSLKLEHLPVRFCRWSGETEAGALASADIGISWLPPDSWSRGKCGLKVLQYMAAGLPVVVNPVGVQTELVQHGETGFLVETPAQWSAAIGRLAADPALRRRFGAAGRRRVSEQFHVQQGAAAWLDLLRTFRHGAALASACPA